MPERMPGRRRGGSGSYRPRFRRVLVVEESGVAEMVVEYSAEDVAGLVKNVLIATIVLRSLGVPVMTAVTAGEAEAESCVRDQLESQFGHRTQAQVASNCPQSVQTCWAAAAAG